MEIEASPETPFEATQRREREARESFRSALIIRSSLLVSSVVLLGVVAYVLSRTLDSRDPMPVMVMVFGVLSILEVIAAFVLPRMVVPLRPTDTASLPVNGQQVASTGVPAQNRGVAGQLLTRSIIEGGCVTMPALLGFVLFVLTGDISVYLPFVALTVVSSALTFPVWSRWENAIAEASRPGF